MISRLSRPAVFGWALITVLLAMAPTLSAASGVWTLESSVKRALEVAPELAVARAEVAARQGAYREADAWPNPSVSIRADDRLGQEDSKGGSDFTQMEFRQPLPLRRLAHARTAAEAGIATARSRARLERLTLERKVAHVFHSLQLAQARRILAEERVAVVEQSRARRGRVVRYLAPAERARLELLRQQARQALLVARAEEERAIIDFHTLLALPAEQAVEVAALREPPTLPKREEVERDLANHPSMAVARFETEAANAGVAVAQSRRFNDPELVLFRERDFLNESRRNMNGIGLSVQVPLWSGNQGPVDRARAEARAVQGRAQITEREARVRLAQAYAQLKRIREQAARYGNDMLTPADQVLTLTRRAFEAGEVNVLALIEALNTHAEVGTRYRELIAEGAEAAAELRLATGRPLIDSPEGNP